MFIFNMFYFNYYMIVLYIEKYILIPTSCLFYVNANICWNSNTTYP